MLILVVHGNGNGAGGDGGSFGMVAVLMVVVVLVLVLVNLYLTILTWLIEKTVVDNPVCGLLLVAVLVCSGHFPDESVLTSVRSL